MRKRKSPIVLVTALVVVVAGIVGFNFATSRVGGNPAEHPPTPEVQDVKPVGASRPAESTTQVASGVQSALGATTTPAPKAAGGPPGMPGAGPLILNPGAGSKPEKPKPNPSSTSAQWYNKDSAMGSGKG